MRSKINFFYEMGKILKFTEVFVKGLLEWSNHCCCKIAIAVSEPQYRQS